MTAQAGTDGRKETLLAASGLGHSFGGLAAVADLDFGVEKGTIKGIIGPNGAGKTTLFNLIAGVLPTSVGEIRFKGQIMNRMPAHKRVSLGMARTFQNLELFAGMTVLENVMIGCHARSRTGFVEALIRTPGSVRETRAIRDKAMEALATLGLDHLAHRQATEISFGEGKIAEIARALAAEPELLMLDEPTAGLPHGDMQGVSDVIRNLNAQGITILLVEHNMRLVMSLCDDILVINYGRRIAEGDPQSVRNDPEVLTAYLGESYQSEDA